MIDHTLDENASVLTVRPTGPLRTEDFNELATLVDPYIERTGGLNGLVLHVEHFPGWDDFPSALRHVRFVHDHHRKVRRIAVVTDSPLGDLAEHVTSRFIAATVKHFPADELDEAKTWAATDA